MAYGCVSRRPGLLLATSFASFCMGSAFLVAPRTAQNHVTAQAPCLAEAPMRSLASGAAGNLVQEVSGFKAFSTVAALGAVLTFAAHQRAAGTRRQAARAQNVRVTSVQGQFVGSSLGHVAARDASTVTCFAKKNVTRGVPMSERQGYIKDAKVLYLKKRNYKNRHKKNLRNRAYNLCYRNRFKATISKIYRLCKQMLLEERPDNVPSSMEEAKAVFEPMFDEACFKLDDAAVQGVISKEEAVFRKDMMLKRVVNACAKCGYLELPEDIARTPAFEVLGYEVPKHDMLREPRPWQLPGWKSPWVLFAEFQQWENWRIEKAKEEAESAAQVEEVEESVAA
mmetsp:Transcript_23967/g.55330  ORF Transcript_23967/g.55330 Transcript_23967/m.55330 type:complete len:339 (-) Transcript_23967:63-1079(-)